MMRSLRLRPLASRTSSEHLSGRWLILVRGAWIVCALLLLANFVASIPAYYHLLSVVCPVADQGQCTNTSGQLAPGTVQLLVHLHLSLSSYAASFTILDVFVSLIPWGVGLLIFWRKSDEAMGLLVSLLLVLFGATGGFNSLLGVWTPVHPSLLISILLQMISGTEWIGLGAFLLTFPTGQMTPRWSWLILLCWIISFVSGFTPWDLLGLTGYVGLGGTFFIMIYRYWRVFTAVQRQQAKWFIYAVVIGLSLFSISSTITSVVPANSPLQLLFPALIILVPSVFIYPGLGFAMLRYHLWDIDIIINKTLVYGLLTVSLLGIYLLLVFGGQYLLASLFGPSNAVVLVISTLIVAALFQPLRRLAQQLIDRRFYRNKYDAARIMTNFNATLRQEINLNQMCAELLVVVQETMQPASLSLWLRPRKSQQEPGKSEARLSLSSISERREDPSRPKDQFP